MLYINTELYCPRNDEWPVFLSVALNVNINLLFIIFCSVAFSSLQSLIIDFVEWREDVIIGKISKNLCTINHYASNYHNS